MSAAPSKPPSKKVQSSVPRRVPRRTAYATAKPRNPFAIQDSRESTHLDTGVLQNTQQHRKLQFWRVFDRDAAYDWIAGDLPYTTECPKLLPGRACISAASSLKTIACTRSLPFT